MSKRTAFNTFIDALSLMVFMGMISTGLLLKYVLPPGSGRSERLLTGQHRGRGIDLYMGLSRHEWGQIHFYIALTFLVLLMTHLTLHWNWIQCKAFGTPQQPHPLKRRAVTIGIILFIILTLLFPWIAPKQSVTSDEFRQLREATQTPQ